MGSEYATGEGSSFARAGKEPVMRGRGNSLGSSKGGRQGMAKAAVESVRGWIGDTGALMGWTGRSKHDF